MSLSKPPHFSEPQLLNQQSWNNNTYEDHSYETQHMKPLCKVKMLCSDTPNLLLSVYYVQCDALSILLRWAHLNFHNDSMKLTLLLFILYS